MAARTNSRNARYLAVLGLAILLASVYLIVRPIKSAGVPNRRSGAGAEGAPSVEPPVTPLDSTVTRGREGILADAAPDSGVDAPPKAEKPAVDIEVEVVDPDGKPVAGVP